MPREDLMSNDDAATPVATFHMELQVLSDSSVRVRVECEEISKEVPVEFINDSLGDGFDHLQAEATRIVRALREKEEFEKIMRQRPETGRAA